jgi:hypothetical protein
MIQRRERVGSRYAGAAAIVSTRALNVDSFIARGDSARYGTKPPVRMPRRDLASLEAYLLKPGAIE